MGMLLLLALMLAGPVAAAAPGSLMADLVSAASLFEKGLLSVEEFALAKARLLAPPEPPPPAPVPHPGMQLRTFGTGWSASVFNGTEQTIFEHTVSPGSVGVMTHFWITGLEQVVHSTGTLFATNGTDNVTVRYYIDGEATASIAFKPPMAAGVGFHDDSANGDPTGMAHRLIGRAGMGGWYVNLKIPFGVSVRVTVTKDGPPGPYGWKQAPSFVIVRGCENLPVMVGAQTLPPSARLRLHKIEGRVFQPLDWVPLLDIPTGQGLVLLVALAAKSSSYKFWEGCMHMYSPYAQPFPGTLLSTGTEDYFDSAFGFDTGRFHGPVSGCTHRKGGMPGPLGHSGDPKCFTNGTGETRPPSSHLPPNFPPNLTPNLTPNLLPISLPSHSRLCATRHRTHPVPAMEVSAYRFHEEDPLAFAEGVKVVWRVSDILNYNLPSPKCFIEAVNRSAGDQSLGGAPTVVTSYVWVYTW